MSVSSGLLQLGFTSKRQNHGLTSTIRSDSFAGHKAVSRGHSAKYVWMKYQSLKVLKDLNLTVQRYTLMAFGAPRDSRDLNSSEEIKCDPVILTRPYTVGDLASVRTITELNLNHYQEISHF